MDDDADNYGIDEMDLIAEEPYNAAGSSSSLVLVQCSLRVLMDDANKIAYHLPAMGGLTAGVSHTDSGAAGGTDVNIIWCKYSMDAAGASITLGYATVTR